MSGAQAQPRSVVIVDDHPLFRQGVRQMLELDGRFQVIGEAADGATAVALIRQQRPHLAILDLNLPDANGLDVAKATQDTGTRAVVLTMLKDEAALNQALRAGVFGYVLKDGAADEIVNCLLSVSADEHYVSPALTKYLLRRRQKSDALAEKLPGLEQLTTAEMRILKRIADKMTTKAIAAELQISPRTVESHRANICTKLQLKGNNSLLQFAIEHRDALSGLR